MTIIQNRLTALLPADFLALLPPSRELAFFALDRLHEVNDVATLRGIQDAFSSSLKLLYLILIGPTAVAMVVSWLMRDLPLNREMESEYGLREKQ